MYDTAQLKNLAEEAYEGGIIIDEISIQPDRQISTRDGCASLVGCVDLGSENAALDSLRAGVHKQELVTHVLQMEFLSFWSGFVFPFAHFPTRGAQAHHLCLLFWEAVKHLLDYGFKVKFCFFDWAVSNRTF